MLKLIVKLLFCLVVAGSSCAPELAIAQEGKGKVAQPNIILVMTDDQGYGDLGCHGHPFLKTPNLDRLYAQSTRFTDFQVSPTCAPTRAALMSGLAPFKNGVTHTILERDRMALTSTTIAEVLKSAGYTTGIFGKWHLGDEDPYQPHQRGFDEVFIHGAGGIGQNYKGSQSDAPGNKYFNPSIKHNGTFVKTEGYCTDVFFQQALGWIKDQSTKTDEKKPFFAYIATNAPHSPYNVGKSYSKPFEALCSKKKAANFYGMIVNIDENIGLLMEKVDEWDLTDNTLLIFMTDNGTAQGLEIYNAGMRGKKGTVNEGGCRVPLFMRLPGLTKAEVDVDVLARHYDILPTLADIAGAKIPEDLKLDGRSLLPLVKNPKAEWEDRYFFFHKGRWAKAGVDGPDNSKHKNFAVRDEKWRLVGNQLYDIENDPGENTDVSAEHPQVVAKMRAAYDVWWDEVRPMMINENAPLDVGKPFLDQFRAQKESDGIPKWSRPEL